MIIKERLRPGHVDGPWKGYALKNVKLQDVESDAESNFRDQIPDLQIVATAAQISWNKFLT